LKRVHELLGIEDDEIDTTSYLCLDDGTKIGEWTKTGIKFQEGMVFDQNRLGKNLIKFFEKQNI